MNCFRGYEIVKCEKYYPTEFLPLFLPIVEKIAEAQLTCNNI